MLRALPGVADVVVAGRPDAEWGERVVAWIVPDGTPPTLDEVRGHVRASLPAFAAPRELHLVETIPRTALGKPARHLLTP